MVYGSAVSGPAIRIIMKTSIRPIFQSGIDIVWPLVKEGLDKIESKGMSDEPQELIRQWLKTMPFIMLYLMYSNNEYIGFLIGKVDIKIHHQEFCIYKAFMLPEFKRPDDIVDEIRKIAEVNKCKYMTFYSQRKGWKKEAEKLGFREGYTQYLQEV